MATKDATGTKQLPTFSNLKPYEQLAITLKSEGVKYEEIVNTINAEFTLAYNQSTLRQWFMAGGKLEQAYLEYNEWYADQAIIEAKLRIKKSSVKAAQTLEELQSDKYDGTVRHNAAKTILAKYIPDRQVVIDETRADEIPSVIGDAGDKVISEDPQNGQDEVANTPESQPVDPEVRT